MLSAAAVVACALGLLGRSPSSTVPIVFLEQPPRGVSKTAEGFTRLDEPDRIYLITSSEAFRDAQRAPFEAGHRAGCKKIASVIVHEEWHLKHGPDEEGAYLAQMTILEYLRADTVVINTVRRVMAQVVQKQRQDRLAANQQPPILITPSANTPTARAEDTAR